MTGSRPYWLPLFLLLFLAHGVLFGQQSITGTVADGRSREPLPGASVTIPGLQKGTSADAGGNFLIEGMFPPHVSVRISHIGFRDTLVTFAVTDFKDILVLLEPDSIEMASVVITASRMRQSIGNIPQRVDAIDPQTIEGFPATNTDNLLRMIPGINVNRSWGIFSRNASVTMRGMPGSSRSLILLDGIPLNKTAGGTISWHLVTPEEIQRIEVVKGPGSTIYGNNAMGGVINIITKEPADKLEGAVDIGYGTYNTARGQVNLRGSSIKDSKGLYWKLGGFYRQGDGYILEPGDVTDSINVDAYLSEGNANGMLGYRFSANSSLEVDYRFYKDKRGSGLKVYEQDGSYESFTNNNVRVDWKGMLGKMTVNAKAFYLNELYYRQNENVNTSGEYKLVDTETDKDDYGLWMSLSGRLGRSHHITTGIDLKNGSLDNREIYRTSTDNIHTRGNLFFAGIFLQDEISLQEGRFRIVAGIRLDHARFYDGRLDVQDPTGKTGFPGDLTETFPASGWMQLSPKVALNYAISSSLRTFLSASTGFMPPRLDDLAGSRKIRRGFKVANPDLVPETLGSLEWGLDWELFGRLGIKPSVFYSRGNDFQYLVATGDFIDSGTDDPVPVYQRQNVSKVEVTGAELGADLRIRENISVHAAYTYNHSKILDYQSTDEVDLTGKYLNEVPANLVYLSFNWRNRVVDLFVDYGYTDEQWYDEENTEIIGSYQVVNLRLSRPIVKGLRASLDIQDLFDEQFIDRKGYLSPGRFFMFEINYTFNK